MKPMKADTARSTTTAAHGQTLPHKLAANAIQTPVTNTRIKPSNNSPIRQVSRLLRRDRSASSSR